MAGELNTNYLLEQLRALLAIPSPSGYTDQIVHFVGEELKRLQIPFEVTRRGAIRANLKGKKESPDRAIVVHLDTIGAMVRRLKSNGRLAVTPVGTWPSRFAEGCRATVFTTERSYRGTILPLKASGHVHGDQVNTQPITWDQLEVRIDEFCNSVEDLKRKGFNVGDFVAVEPGTEVMENGFIVSRHLDDKAGVATLLAVAKCVEESKVKLPVDCHLLFTISEEIGSGASSVLHQDVAEMVSIDSATPAKGQNSIEGGVTICMLDSTGPFDYHLTQKLIQLCEKNSIRFERDVFRNYRCDAASAIEAGNDLRTALVCFGTDASHGYERTHISSLEALGKLLLAYSHSEEAVEHDKDQLGPLEGFPEQPM